MNQILGYCIEDLEERNGYHTAMEIINQPRLWRKIYDNIIQNDHIKKFFQDLGELSHYNIILTGAGSSAFIGTTLESAYMLNMSPYSRAIPTTTLVTHPELYFPDDRPTLMISFARSGNSPESLASMMLANEICEDIRHLVVTCNPEGKLVNKLDMSRDCLFLLPEEANDKGLAMTGSFTGMLLCGYLVTRLSMIQDMESDIEILERQGSMFILHALEKLKALSDLDFKKCIFLGSGPLLGIACESHLKVQELTNGRVMCNYYSYLGLRHGPKVVLDRDTLVICLQSNDPYVRQYEQDLIDDIVNESLGMIKIGVSDNYESGLDMDLHLNLHLERNTFDPCLYALMCTLPAQVLGFFKSMKLGYSPDEPSENGTISRVVKGFKIYDYNSVIQ